MMIPWQLWSYDRDHCRITINSGIFLGRAISYIWADSEVFELSHKLWISPFSFHQIKTSGGSRTQVFVKLVSRYCLRSCPGSPISIIVLHNSSCERVTKGCGRPAVDVSGQKVEGTWHFSWVHLLIKDVRWKWRHLRWRRLQVRLLKRKRGGGVHLKMQKGARPIFGFEIWVRRGVDVKNWLWVLRLQATVLSSFHPHCNVIFRKLLRFHFEENLQHCYTSTRCDGKICRQINCHNIIPGILFNIFVTLQKMLHCQRKTCYTQKFVHAKVMQ